MVARSGIDFAGASEVESQRGDQRNSSHNAKVMAYHPREHSIRGHAEWATTARERLYFVPIK